MVEMTIVAQILIALTIYSVWLIRPNWKTAYRAVDARNLKEEFAVYRPPIWVGALFSGCDKAFTCQCPFSGHMDE